MPRSSRHKSSKRGSRDARDFSDSERETAQKGKKEREENNGNDIKGLASGEKRKFSTHEENGWIPESSKQPKDIGGRCASSKRNEGGDSKEVVQKLKQYGDSKSRGSKKSDESVEEEKTSNEKGDEKQNKGYSRKESKDGGTGRQRTSRDEKNKKVANNAYEGQTMVCKSVRAKGMKWEDFEEEHTVKMAEENTVLGILDELQDTETGNSFERRNKRRKDDSIDGDYRQDITKGTCDRTGHRDDVAKAKIVDDGTCKDGRHGDKHREEPNNENKRGDSKQIAEHLVKAQISNKPSNTHARDEDGNHTIKQKKPMLRDSDNELNRDRERSRKRARDHSLDHYRHRHCSHDRHRDCGDDRERGSNNDRGRRHDRDCGRTVQGHGHLCDCDQHHDAKGRKRTPNDLGDRSESRSENIKVNYSNGDKKSAAGSKTLSGSDKDRFQSRQATLDSPVTIGRCSPTSSSHAGIDGCRNSKAEDSSYRDSITERAHVPSTKDSTGGSPAARVPKCTSAERSSRKEDRHSGDFSVERSLRSKTSPRGSMRRFSSASTERRYVNKSCARRSRDGDEIPQRGSDTIDARDNSVNEDRFSHESPSEKQLMNESSQADSFVYKRTGQRNSSSSIPPLHAFRGRVDSPSFLGSADEDSRHNSGTRYRRSVDHNVGRGRGNAWKCVPHWSSALPNAFIPFQPRPPHGGFQPLISQFPPPAMFGVRPPMEVNHPGMQYHILDSDRFPGHFRPFGWRHMVDGSCPPPPPHLPGWDGNGYMDSEWDPSIHPLHGRGWDPVEDAWKGNSFDMELGPPSTSMKSDYPVEPPPTSEFSGGKAIQRFRSETHNYDVQAKDMETGSRGADAMDTCESPSPTSPKNFLNLPSVASCPAAAADDEDFCYVYLSKLNISSELALPEVYDQCMSKRNVDQSQTIVEQTTNHVALENEDTGPRKVLHVSDPLFPPVEDSIFQRAMGLYMKERQTRLTRVAVSNMDLDLVQEEDTEMLPSAKLVPTPTASLLSDQPADKGNNNNPEEELLGGGCFKISGLVMPTGSNESDLVSLSRIHHSPLGSTR